VDDVPLAELAARGIVVTNNSGVHAPNIAEHLMAMMLAFARQLPFLYRGQLAREWRDSTTRPRVFELSGQTLLVVGLGDIGLALAERAAAFGMRVIGTRRRPEQPAPSTVSRVVATDRLAEVLPEADHVAICLPLTAGTRGLFDAAMLTRMKPTGYLYNIGRGPIVATDALVEALANGGLGGAGLDVTDPEPLPPDSPLWAMDNVLITMHTSGGTPHYWDRALELLVANIDRYERGEELHNRVDPETGY
jgi:phosphoglycerate dehydrogenase-like enzyme